MTTKRKVKLIRIEPELGTNWTVVDAEKSKDPGIIRAWYESREFEVVQEFKVPMRKMTNILILAPMDIEGECPNQHYLKMRGETICGPILVGRKDPFGRGLASPLPNLNDESADETIKTVCGWLGSKDLIQRWFDIFTWEKHRDQSG